MGPKRLRGWLNWQKKEQTFKNKMATAILSGAGAGVMPPPGMATSLRECSHCLVLWAWQGSWSSQVLLDPRDN